MKKGPQGRGMIMSETLERMRWEYADALTTLKAERRGAEKAYKDEIDLTSAVDWPAPWCRLAR